MDDDLPSSFDVVVIGTGLTESIVSAAAARNGHSVLHIDLRNNYGGKWATFPWNEWLTGSFAQEPNTFVSNQDSGLVWRNEIRDFEQIWYSDDVKLKEELAQSSRKFNIDLFPQVVLTREPLIQLLIQSNVSRYLEFKCITKLMCSLAPPDDHQIESIPISKSDVFTTKAISLIEKRGLMRFIEYVLKPPTPRDNLPQLDTAGPNESVVPTPITEIPIATTFHDLAVKHKISPRVKHFILSAVRTMDDCCAMAMKGQGDEYSSEEGFSKKCRLFLESIGRYGNETPFLWTLYGISEICQAFCRLSAIYGGIFILKRPVESIAENPESGLINIKTGGAEIQTKFLILSPELKFRQTEMKSSPKCRQGITLVRAFLLVSGPRLKAELGDTPNLTVYRFGDADVFELDESSLATTKDYRLLQVTCPFHASDSENKLTPAEIIKAKLAHFVEFAKPSPVLTTEENPEDLNLATGSDTAPTIPITKPLVHYGSYFFLDFLEEIDDLPTPKNIFSCATSSAELTGHVEKACQIFSAMYPDEEFLPKAPDAPEAKDADEDHEPASQLVQNGVANEGEAEGQNPDNVMAVD